uniref:Uncharacterized protein n=1 Tax=Anopheles coluzzii TaxID=1518534 RepID=A0A8W7P5Y1_ANOCL
MKRPPCVLNKYSKKKANAGKTPSNGWSETLRLRTPPSPGGGFGKSFSRISDSEGSSAQLISLARSVGLERRTAKSTPVKGEDQPIRPRLNGQQQQHQRISGRSFHRGRAVGRIGNFFKPFSNWSLKTAATTHSSMN